MAKKALPVIDKVGSPEVILDVEGKARFSAVQRKLSLFYAFPAYAVYCGDYVFLRRKCLFMYEKRAFRKKITCYWRFSRHGFTCLALDM